MALTAPGCAGRLIKDEHDGVRAEDCAKEEETAGSADIVAEIG
jgi:hypothetical protein